MAAAKKSVSKPKKKVVSSSKEKVLRASLKAAEVKFSSLDKKLIKEKKMQKRGAPQSKTLKELTNAWNTSKNSVKSTQLKLSHELAVQKKTQAAEKALQKSIESMTKKQTQASNKKLTSDIAEMVKILDKKIKEIETFFFFSSCNN